MAKRSWKVVVFAGMIVGPAPWAHADDTLIPDRTVTSLPPTAGRPDGARQARASFAPQLGQTLGGGASPVSFTRLSQVTRGQTSPTPFDGQSSVATAPGSNIVRLPPTDSALGSRPVAKALPAPGLPVDGTYREDGQYVTITIDGKEMRLVKPHSESIPTPAPQITGAGSVRGRLMQNGRPLVNCRVVIVPLQGERNNYHYDSSREPLASTTDGEGIYSFEHAPIGQYKLTWLPDGTNQWIRRVSIRPDVVVRSSGEAVNVNTIGAARQTIN